MRLLLGKWKKLIGEYVLAGSKGLTFVKRRAEEGGVFGETSKHDHFDTRTPPPLHT